MLRGAAAAACGTALKIPRGVHSRTGLAGAEIPLRMRGQRDLIAETLQAFHRLPRHPLVVAMGEGLHAKVDIGWLLLSLYRRSTTRG
ncbi:MAG: hypothetical protein M0Z53_01765 [Thermaerobacter sp.]|nr:hypothetical protein [Thermaerobacter sp.]